MSEPDSNPRARGEEALGDLAQALLDNPLFNTAVARAVGAGERAVQAQRSAMGAVGVAFNTDVERLERRLRMLSARMDEIEDRFDELGDELAALRRGREGGVSSDQGSLAVSDRDPD